MADEKKTILLDGGREVNVTLVAKAPDFLAQLLGDAPTKSGMATLQLVKNTAGKSFAAVRIGGKHVGFLSDSDAQELFPTLADCERDGVVAQAQGRISAPPGSSEQPVLTLSLPVPGPSFSAATALEANVPSAVIEPPMSQPMPSQHCRSCGKALPPNAKFCLGCGTPIVVAPVPAEGTAVPAKPALPVVPSVAVAVPGRSEFDGSILGFLGMGLGCMLFTGVTFGVGLPWALVWWQRWVTKHTIIGGYRLRFTGSGSGMLWRWVKMELFTLITVGIYGLWAWRYLKRWTVEHTELAV